MEEAISASIVVDEGVEGDRASGKLQNSSLCILRYSEDFVPSESVHSLVKQKIVISTFHAPASEIYVFIWKKKTEVEKDLICATENFRFCLACPLMHYVHKQAKMQLLVTVLYQGAQY